MTAAGKPAKVALRHDAARRAFRAALTPALDGLRGSGAWDVEVGAHPVHGTQASIAIARADGLDAARIKAQIGEIMSRYAFAYEIVWQP